MRKKVRIGIIGAGWPGQQHARAVRASQGGLLQTLAEPNEERRGEFIKAYEPVSSYRDYTDLLGDSKVDAIVNCLPNHLHFSVSLSALRAGKHVFCEKPPTLNSAEMRVLHEEGQHLGLVYFFGRQFRFTPGMRMARELIARDELGKIYFAEATWVRSRGIPSGIGGWFTEKKRSGGGALIDIGVHALDSAWFLMGTPRPLSVTAAVFQNFKQFVPAQMTFDVEDAAFAFIRFRNDAVVQLKTSWAGNLPDDIPQGLYFGRELNNCTVYGAKATVRLQPLTLFRDENGRLTDQALQPNEQGDAFELQMQNFIDAILGQAGPMNDSQQALYLMEMLDAIYLSSATGREVPIARA